MMVPNNIIVVPKVFTGSQFSKCLFNQAFIIIIIIILYLGLCVQVLKAKHHISQFFFFKLFFLLLLYSFELFKTGY